MSELGKRVLSAIIAAPLFLAVTWLGGWYFWVLIAVITVIIQYEINIMLEKQEIKAWMPGVITLSFPILLIPVFPEGAWMLFLSGLLLVFILETFRSGNRGWTQLAPTIMLGVTIPALFSGLILIRNTGESNEGLILTFALLFMVWANDVFAYFGGKLTGKHKLAPSISPNKTVEGFLWGLAGSIMVVVFFKLAVHGFPLAWAGTILFAFLTGCAGPAGDLAESKLKRAAGIKDSSNVLPGHGGFYDRFDAVLFSAPAAAVFIYVTQMISVF
ncbi:phosphatidate cytidylyltransferase [Balneolaceae bacterium ANBcel3]|nr:phosphatidate cytidylyltransferase [Balneolaceae bacterium ANBcel3]